MRSRSRRAGITGRLACPRRKPARRSISRASPGSSAISAGVSPGRSLTNRLTSPICSHTLEDLRDPLWVCAELVRVAKAGYVEVPSRAAEQSRGWEHPRIAGLSHHRWLIEIDGPAHRVPDEVSPPACRLALLVAGIVSAQSPAGRSRAVAVLGTAIRVRRARDPRLGCPGRRIASGSFARCVPIPG